MNFHYELRKSSCRKELKRRTGRSLDILEVRRHELVIGRSPTWAPCRIRYYPAVGRMSIHGPAGQYIGWNRPAGPCRYKPSIARVTGF